VGDEEDAQPDERQQAGDPERERHRLLERDHQRQADDQQPQPDRLERPAAHGSNLCPSGS
jgi:hypothetical protein